MKTFILESINTSLVGKASPLSNVVFGKFFALYQFFINESRYFTYTNTRRYVEVLPALVESYNNTYHRTIGRAPNSVNAENQEAVWLTLYAYPELRKPKLKVGDQVRLSMTRMRFRKGYLPGWTDELFQVAQVFRDNPPYYKIKDLQGEWLEGTFYEEELQKIYKKDDVFRLERILKQRKRKKGFEFLVKWFV